MQRRKVPLTVVATALSACAIESELLNSERIEERFGNYGIEVISADPGLRRSNLYSTDEGIRTCRTYALVRFVEKPNAVIGALHSEILAGASIGATFKANGWTLEKESLFVGAANLTAGSNDVAELMRLESGSQVAMHVYRLLLEKDSETLEYATILELHHPDYLTPTELQDLYSIDRNSDFDPSKIDEFVELGIEAA